MRLRRGKWVSSGAHEALCSDWLYDGSGCEGAISK